MGWLIEVGWVHIFDILKLEHKGNKMNSIFHIVYLFKRKRWERGILILGLGKEMERQGKDGKEERSEMD